MQECDFSMPTLSQVSPDASPKGSVTEGPECGHGGKEQAWVKKSSIDVVSQSDNMDCHNIGTV